MRLFVMGANGRIGGAILDLAYTRGHQITAFVRSPEKLERARLRLTSAGLAGGTGSLTVVRGNPRQPESIADALPGHDAVLSAIGPHPREALRPSTLVTDCARATVDAMGASASPVSRSCPRPCCSLRRVFTSPSFDG
jgi:uncharacterized protein YbjT (DUF2867 family)